MNLGSVTVRQAGSDKHLTRDHDTILFNYQYNRNHLLKTVFLMININIVFILFSLIYKYYLFLMPIQTRLCRLGSAVILRISYQMFSLENLKILKTNSLKISWFYFDSSNTNVWFDVCQQLISDEVRTQFSR